uniref:tRNA wybutosine-synthesizing protein 4 n=1 Tax=Ciona savignyi TaxID=51511 RepID=H2ZI59_CIOSA
MTNVVKNVNVEYQIDQDNFAATVQTKRKPCVLKGMDIGECRSKWTVEYLSDNCGPHDCVVHVSETSQMDFINKNYLYRKLPFREVVKRASVTKHTEYFINPKEFYYFRSLGENVRTEASNITEQFPQFKDDIKIPQFFPQESFFSSVFRISSAGMQLWTHYDVMDNLLIQINGRKRVTLFPPSDALYLYLHGDKSMVTDIDRPDLTKFPNFIKAKRYECVLEAGDILFIPALWFHNVIALEFGIAVNVFWKNLKPELYDKKDPYGNKDLIPAARSMDILNRALKVLDELPEEYRDFYARKMVAKIQEKSY